MLLLLLLLIRPANQETPTLARPCHPHARWQVAQRHSVWRACHWIQTHRKAYTPLQRRAQAGPQGRWHCASRLLKRWHRTAAVGDTLPSQLSRQQSRRERSSGKKRELAGAREQRQIQHPWMTTSSHAANCNRVCSSRIGLYSHSRRCNSPTD